MSDSLAINDVDVGGQLSRHGVDIESLLTTVNVSKTNYTYRQKERVSALHPRLKLLRVAHAKSLSAFFFFHFSSFVFSNTWRM